MKAIKYLVMGALLTGFSATANAQEAELNAALDGIKSQAPNVAKLAEVAFKKNKKNPEAILKIAQAFYAQKDTANARLTRLASQSISLLLHTFCWEILRQAMVQMVVRLQATTTRLSPSTQRTQRVTRSGLWFIVRSAQLRQQRSWKR